MIGRRAWPPLLVALGAVQTFAFVQTWAWPLPLLCVALLAAAVAHVAPWRAAVLGWCFGVGWLLAGTWWLYISMHRYGGLAAPLAAAAVFLLAAALSLYLALAMAAVARWRSGRVGADALLFGAVWLLAELARGVIFTGFPWVASGYAQIDGPLAALAPWLGVYGIGAWAAVAMALAAATTRQRRWPAAAAALVLAAPLALAPFGFSGPSGTLAVTLLQPNVPQDEKFVAERMPEILANVARALYAARGDLVIAPETAVPLLPTQLEEAAPAYWPELRRHFAAAAPAALVGVPLGDYDHGYTNSAAGLAGGPDYRYDKQHLVPFGEFVPHAFRWFTELMNIPLGDFNRGIRNPPSFAVRGERVAPTICYEDVFGEEIALRFADPAQAPTVFANLSNVGWFGDTTAIPEHLAMSRMRSLEFERPMVRATNTGATAIVDYRGRVTAQLPPLTAGVLVGSVQGRSGVTPFAWWAARWGLWPPALFAFVVVALAVWRKAESGR